MSEPLLARTCDIASKFLDTIDERDVGARASYDELYATLGGRLPEQGQDPLQVIEALARDADPGIMASTGGRMFGFVIGATLPSARAADWLVSTWDPCAGFYALSPASAVIEDIVSEWVINLLGLPQGSTVGFVTGCQAANFMSLAAARQSVLDHVGWDVSAKGLIGAPPIRIITSAESHGTIDRAFAMLGLGADSAERVPCDDQGRMRADELIDLLEKDDRPTIVCAQAGNVDTGSFDPLEAIGQACQRPSVWLHVDGAFGLWAAASPEKRLLVKGHELADSWATDAHKWLNVPYDSGMVIVRDRTSLLKATNYRGEYLVREQLHRDSYQYTPESSRRARAIPIYAALRELGKQGVAELVERCCAHARRASALLQEGGATICNDVVLNQVLMTFPAPPGIDQSHYIDQIIELVQQQGVCWLGGTTWQGHRAIRLSVSSWRTTEADIEQSVASILACAEEVAKTGGYAQHG